MSLSFVFLIKSTPFKKNENIINEIKEGLTAYRFGTAMSYSIRIYYLFQFFLNYETQKEC